MTQHEGNDLGELLRPASDAELHDLIEYFIQSRECFRNNVLRVLAKRNAALLAELEQIRRAEMMVELRCFRETEALHRRLHK